MNWKETKTLTTAIAAFNRLLDRHIQWIAKGEQIDFPIYHYSKMAAIESILQSAELWLVNVEDMADKAEFRWPLELAQAAISDAMADNDPVVKFFGERFLGGVARSVEAGFGLYSASFCQHADLQSQWINFADHGRGARIAVSVNAFRFGEMIDGDLLSQAFIIPMRYVAEDAERQQREAVAKAVEVLKRPHIQRILLGGPQNGSFLKELSIQLAIWLMFNATKFKQPAFASEAEVRVLVMNEQAKLDNLIQTIEGTTRRYIPYKFDVPLKAPGVIEEIRVGANAPVGAEKKLVQLLILHQYPPVPITRSTVECGQLG